MSDLDPDWSRLAQTETNLGVLSRMFQVEIEISVHLTIHHTLIVPSVHWSDLYTLHSRQVGV